MADTAGVMAPPVQTPPAVAPTPARLFTDCVLLGLTAWGGFMALLAQADRRFVIQRRWVSEQEFMDLIALVSMLPGPQAVNAIAAMGHRVAGWRGFAAALAGIVLPGFAIIAALWFGYAALAGRPDLQHALTIGVLPPLALILAQAAWAQAKKATPGRREKALALVAAVLLLAIPSWAAPIYVLALGAIAARLFWPAPTLAAAEPGRRLRPLEMLLCFAPLAFGVFQLLPALLPEGTLARLGLAFAGIGTTLFGGGLVMVPLLEGLIVDHLGWLSRAGFHAGLAASQLTPGPILSIATFTGMEVAGLAGALVATLGIYLPTALVTVGAIGVADKLKHSRNFQHAMLGVRCAVVGLIAGAAASLLLKLPLQAQAWQCGVLVVAAWALVWRFKLPPYISLPAGVVLAWLLL